MSAQVFTPRSISRREFVAFFCKHQKRLGLAFAIPLILSILISFIPSPRYDASSVLIVRLGSEYVYQPEVGQNQIGPNPTIPFDREQIFKSEVAILSSDDLHRDTIKSIGLAKLYPQLVSDESEDMQLAEAVQKFNKRFDIMLEKESAVIRLSFAHKEAGIAVDTLNALLKLYFDKRRELYLEPRVALAKAQMETTRAHALAATKALADYKLARHVFSIADQRAELLHQRAILQQQALGIKASGIDSRLAALDASLAVLDDEERNLSSLQHEADIAEESYRLYSHKLDGATAYEQLEHERTDSVRVIQPPITPAEPRKLQWLIILGGVFLSILSVLGVAILTEFTQTGFITPEQAERRLGLHVLASFSLQQG